MYVRLLMTLAALFAAPIDVSAAHESPAAAAAGSAFSYDAVEQRDRRKSATIRTTSEDQILDHGKRQQAIANQRDLARNYAICAWMIRKHLDYVSQFEFHARTEDEKLNDEIEAFIRWWSERENFDAAGRHRRSRFMRIAEARRVIDHDVGILRLASGHLQAIEGDRIRNPGGQTVFAVSPRAPGWVHGVKVDSAGRAQKYAVHRRTTMGGYELEREVPAEHLYLHGYFERFDQIRGISPLISGINDLRDVYENVDLAKAKAKVAQLFALAVYQQFESGLGDHEEEEPADTGDEEETTTNAAPKYSVDFGKGPLKVELQDGDRMEVIESKTPGSEFLNFHKVVLMVALKALDLPYSFFDESFTNFFGSRGAWMHYERSAVEKREDNRELLTWSTRWRLRLAVLDGALSLPRGLSVEDLPIEYVPVGMPWWDPAKEIRGDLMAVGGGLDNPQRICKERGRGDFYDNVRQIARAQAFAKELGVQLSFNPGPGDRQQRRKRKEAEDA